MAVFLLFPALAISLAAREKQHDFPRQCQRRGCYAEDVFPCLIRGRTISTEAIGNRNPFSQRYRVSEAGGTRFLLLAQDADGSSWLLLRFSVGFVHSEASCGCGLKGGVFVPVQKGCWGAWGAQQACSGHSPGQRMELGGEWVHLHSS